MALDREYFDSINIEIVKKKYYNANKVNAIFDDIRRQAEALIRENEELKSGQSKDDIADVIVSARYIAQQVVAESKRDVAKLIAESQLEADEKLKSANLEAEEIVRAAKREAQEIRTQAMRDRENSLRQAQERQDMAVMAMSRLVNNLRAQQQAAIDSVNADWQDFLCSLSGDYAPETNAPVPADLHRKVGRLAKEMFSLDD